MSVFYTVKNQNKENEKYFVLKGAWTVEHLSDIHESFSREPLHHYKKITIDGSAIDSFDTAAASYIRQIEIHSGVKPVLKSFSKKQMHMYNLVSRYSAPPEAPEKPAMRGIKHILISAGKKTIFFREAVKYVISIFGEFVYNIIQVGAGTQKLKLRSIIFHVNEIGIRALPVIFLMAFAIALVMGYQGATQLKNFGATIYTIDLVTISVLREMGVLLTAIMVAGRTGSAFAAQIGTMKLNEEIDALQTMGVSPFNALVLPRLCGIIIALPVLTFLANIVALVGLYFYCHVALDIPFGRFISRIEDVITPAHFWTGMIKAPVFALLIGVIGCMQGMRVRGSAEDVGRHTTYAVVQSIFSVILMDAVFSIIFTRLDI